MGERKLFLSTPSMPHCDANLMLVGFVVGIAPRYRVCAARGGGMVVGGSRPRGVGCGSDRWALTTLSRILQPYPLFGCRPGRLWGLGGA